MSRKYKFASPVRYRSGYEKNGAYFVSFATVNWIDVFTRDFYFAIMTGSLDYCRKKKVWKFMAIVLCPVTFI